MKKRLFHTQLLIFLPSLKKLILFKKKNSFDI